VDSSSDIEGVIVTPRNTDPSSRVGMNSVPINGSITRLRIRKASAMNGTIFLASQDLARRGS